MFNLSHEQQKIYKEENPDVDDSQNWMSKNTSLTTSASELSSSEASRTSTSASDGDAPTLAKLPPKKTKAKAPAKKTTAAKAKASSTKSSGAVVSVEACKS